VVFPECLHCSSTLLSLTTIARRTTLACVLDQQDCWVTIRCLPITRLSTEFWGSFDIQKKDSFLLITAYSAHHLSVVHGIGVGPPTRGYQCTAIFISGKCHLMLPLAISSTAKRTWSLGMGACPTLSTRYLQTGVAHLAISRISRFLMVGLTSEWKLSVCLFNFLTTKSRSTHPRQLEHSFTRSSVPGKLSHYPDMVPYMPRDEIDHIVYDYVQERFQALVLQHNISLRTCTMLPA